MNYIFLVSVFSVLVVTTVSFLTGSVTEVSFLVVSTTVVVVPVEVVSEPVEVFLLPQAATDKDNTNAKAPNLNEFFIIDFF
ncbi:hypothetical protein Mucpa_5365 [Mucilaginibacter paludis DSM 18603]|uniref:Uncharacterized protein n=1 Tax=Mucilaginibacter paludis DSM 18603 TaxID=714943 RepID=H1Y961_9SPHI|nr:hypothetical protein Mucpa_5365 [Mucilaginibacter paludis DSM 18603]